MKARKRQHPLKVAKGLTIQGRRGKTWASGGRHGPSALCWVCRWSSEVAVRLNSKQKVVSCLSDWDLSTKNIIWDSGWLWLFSSQRSEKFLSIFFFLFLASSRYEMGMVNRRGMRSSSLKFVRSYLGWRRQAEVGGLGGCWRDRSEEWKRSLLHAWSKVVRKYVSQCCHGVSLQSAAHGIRP